MQEQYTSQGWIIAGMDKTKSVGKNPAKCGRRTYLPLEGDILEGHDEFFTLRVVLRYLNNKFFPGCAMRMETGDKGV